MHDVFISYSHKDAQVADAICHHMEEAGIRCWYAPRNIGPGAEWADAIIEALEECSIVVLVFTDYSNASRQVQREVDTAVTLGKTIIPFKRTQADPTGSMRYYLSTLHWLDAVDTPLDKSIKELVGRAQAILAYEEAAGQRQGADDEQPSEAQHEVKPSPEQPTVTQTKPTVGRSRMPLFAAIAVVVLACVIGLATLGNDRGASATAADTSAPQAEVSDAQDASGDATSTAAEDTTDAANSRDTSSKQKKDEEAPAVEPVEGDDEAASVYLYTVQYDNTIRLDRYFGPENATMVLPTTIEGLPVTNVGEKCFESCEYIEKLVLPQTMEIIQYRAFYGCKNLREVNIPASLKKILGWSFAHTGLVAMEFPDTFESLDYGAFYSCENLERVVLSPSVDHLGENTFRLCGNLKSVTMPAEQVEINAKAFDANTDVKIIGVAGSYAEKYAKGMGLTFETL